MQVTSDKSANQAACLHAPFWKPFWSAMKETLGKVRIQKKLRALRIEETLPLGERRFLALVRWENQRLLLGVTPQTITLLQPETDKETRRFGNAEEPEA